MSAKAPNTLARTIRGFFLERLPLERGLTPNTSKSYRDALVLFLRFLADRLKRPVVEVDLDDFDRGNVLEFLDHLKARRGNAVSSRNARLDWPPPVPSRTTLRPVLPSTCRHSNRSSPYLGSGRRPPWWSISKARSSVPCST